MNRYLILFSFFIFQAFITHAQNYQLSGKISEPGGETIPFTSVLVKGTSKGASANAEGMYQLSLEKGNHVLVFKSIGFKAVERAIVLNKDLVLNIEMEAESYTLQNIVITPNAEDPAYAIIREAIRLRKKHLAESDEFYCMAYTKGMQKLVGAPRKFFGRDVQKTLNLDTNRKGILYLSESQSKFNYKRPGKVHEEMLSSKISGNNAGFSFNKASDLMVNFYENLLLEGSGLSARSFVSPIADNALFYYRYKLLGISEENGIRINKIEVIPRRTNDPVFRGIIYISEDSWRIMGTQLYLSAEAGINLLDTLQISQQFIQVDKTYMPSMSKFEFKGAVIGFKFEGYFIGVFNDYNVKPQFKKGFFTGEILKVTKTVNKKDSLYWANSRPIPLSLEEEMDYHRKDSIALRRQSKAYLDSLERANNRFGLGKLLITGYSLNNRYEKKYISFSPLFSAIFFNTVEGFALKYSVSYRKVLEDRKYYAITPTVRYGFSNKTFTANLQATYFYDPVKRASFLAGIGSDIMDLNNLGTMSLFTNSINSLFFNKNYLKLYKKEYAFLTASREIANGLQASFKLNYSRNYSLKNHSDFTFIKKEGEGYTSNNPFTPDSESPLFPNYRSFALSAGLSYTIGQEYITRPDGKFYQESKYPRLLLNYRKGVKSLFGSDVDYDLVTMEVAKERISTGLLGYFSFAAGAGKFLNNRQVYYPEVKHFLGNNSTAFPPNLRKFRYLDFYTYSTHQQYAEAHIEHNFAGFLTNKIPLLRKLKLEEYIGVNYLTQPQKRNYTEFYFGVQRLGFGVSYGYAFDESKRVAQGFRLAYGL